MSDPFDHCTAVTASDRRCRRIGAWTVDGALMRPQCYQHALAKARDEGLRNLVDLAHGRLLDVGEIPKPTRRLRLPRTYEQVMAALPTLRSLDELQRVIGVVINADPPFPGFKDRDSDLRVAIRHARDQLKRTASTEEVERNGGGWKPNGVGAIAAGNMRRAGVSIQ